jgi:hypothetical protein
MLAAEETSYPLKPDFDVSKTKEELEESTESFNKRYRKCFQRYKGCEIRVIFDFPQGWKPFNNTLFKRIDNLIFNCFSKTWQACCSGSKKKFSYVRMHHLLYAPFVIVIILDYLSVVLQALPSPHHFVSFTRLCIAEKG